MSESTQPTESDGLPDAVVLHCPKCRGRGIIFRRRSPARTYRRVTDWVWRMATFQCDGCGYDHRFTADWLSEYATTPGRSA